jgi:hypothetical protein
MVDPNKAWWLFMMDAPDFSIAAFAISVFFGGRHGGFAVHRQPSGGFIFDPAPSFAFRRKRIGNRPPSMPNEL